MSNATVFLSFTHILDPSLHAEYNEWHQLDHRPENLALPGVLYGERWVRCPACAQTGPAPNDLLDDLHYLNAYWFAEPWEQSVQEWQELAERSLDEGRRPDVRIARRQLMGYFRQVQVVVSPRLSVSASALPYRPTRGVHALVEEIGQPRSPEAESFNRWNREVRLPRLASADGVAGVCDLVSISTTLDPAVHGHTTSNTLLLSPAAQRGRIRVTLSFLDDDPLVVAEALHQLTTPAELGVTDVRSRTLLCGILKTITPWEWDWFGD